MTDNEIIKAWDILAKFDFFGGQRAGRELWNKKPVDVQNEDIENFSKDVAFLKDFINRQNAEIEKLNVELVGMRGACESYKIHYDNAQAEIERLTAMVEAAEDYLNPLPFKNAYDEAIDKAKSEAYREFAEILRTTNSTVENVLNKLLSNDMGRYDHYTDSFVKEPTESNE